MQLTTNNRTEHQVSQQVPRGCPAGDYHCPHSCCAILHFPFPRPPASKCTVGLYHILYLHILYLYPIKPHLIILLLSRIRVCTALYVLNERNSGHITDVWAKKGRAEPGLVDMWAADNIYADGEYVAVNVPVSVTVSVPVGVPVSVPVGQ